MKKRLIFLTSILFLCIVMTKAQNDRTVNESQYTIDKQIPSFMEITDKGITFPKRTALKARHIGLERLLDLSDKTNAILSDTLTDVAGGFHESCTEYYHGLEVEGTRYTIHYNKNGFPTSANGNFRTVRNLVTVPKISESDALKGAKSHIGAEKYSWEDGEECPKGKLVVLVKDDNAFLAYKFAINAIVPYSYQFIFINAEDGSFLDSYSAEYPISSSVQTRYSNTVQIETQYYDSNYRLRDYSRGDGIKTYNSYSQDYLSPNSSWTNMSYFDRSALDVHWGLESTYDFYYTTFGRNSYDNNGGEIVSLVNDTTYKNACWEPNYHRMRYGFLANSAGTPLLDFPLVSLDVTAHELTHGFTQSTSGLSYEKESGALNEGISDVFAVCVEKAITPYKGDYIWCIGEDVSTLRNLSNPSCRYYHGKNWHDVNDSYDHGWVHNNSGVFSYWFYLISKGGTGENQSHLNYPVQSIGFDKAIQICYLMNASYLFPNATYSNAKSCSYLAAQALGYDNNVIDQLRKAWIDVGVESPKLKIVGNSFFCSNASYYIDDLPPGCTVSWRLSDSYYNNGYNLLIQNYPTTGHCLIIRDNNHDLTNDTLTATIKYNGETIRTLTKTGIYAYSGFWGQYSSGNLSGNINYTCFFNIKANNFTTIFSPNFYDATVSYNSSGAIPSSWSHNPNSGVVSFYTTNTSAPVIINVHDCCGNDYVLYAYPSSLYSINASNGVNGITVTLVEEGNASKDFTPDQSWTIEVRSAATGELMTTLSSISRSETISTVGWPKGVYIIKVTIGKEELTEKVIVK